MSERKALPTSALSLSSLRTLEEELCRRGLVKLGAFHPLWFAAETEISLFLWKRGYSLTHRDRFEFWLDIPSLIAKRRLEIADHGNGDPDALLHENYLAGMEEQLAKLGAHAHAMSYVTTLLEQELEGKTSVTEEVVVLPSPLTLGPVHSTSSANR